MHPTNPDIIVVGSMDACISIRAAAPLPQALNWAAYYRSTDGGRTWKASLMPGYPGSIDLPGDEGCFLQADPTLAFDADGRLYYGGLCLVYPQGTAPADFRIAVAVFDEDYSRLERVVQVDRQGPLDDPVINADKPWIAVDRSGGEHHGNLYVAWTRCVHGVPCLRPAEVSVATSNDAGETYSPETVFRGADDEEVVAPDVAIDRDGVVYVTYKSLGADTIWLVRSEDGGTTWTAPVVVATMTPFPGEDVVNGNCGDGTFSCARGYNHPVMPMLPVIAAHDGGVSVAWSGAVETGQGQIFIKHSPDGVDWSGPATLLNPQPVGHQWSPDLEWADGVLTAVYYDSRNDPAYGPDRPPGNTADGKNGGDAVDVFASQSRNGGASWTEQRLTSRSFQPNYETYHDARFPWLGDYITVSATAGRTFAVWADARDVVPGDDTRGDSEDNGFDVHAPCVWVPDTVFAPPGGYVSPAPKDPCLNQGGLDTNVYGASVTASAAGRPPSRGSRVASESSPTQRETARGAASLPATGAPPVGAGAVALLLSAVLFKSLGRAAAQPDDHNPR